MRRYFVCDENHPVLSSGTLREWHAIHLDTHGPNGAGKWAIVIFDDDADIPDDWEPLPAVYDLVMDMKTAKLGKVLKDVGVLETDKAHGVAKKLAAIHPKFKP